MPDQADVGVVVQDLVDGGLGDRLAETGLEARLASSFTNRVPEPSSTKRSNTRFTMLASARSIARRLVLPDVAVNSLAASVDGRWAASAPRRSRVRSRSGTSRRGGPATCPRWPPSVHAAFAPDGRTLAAINFEGQRAKIARAAGTPHKSAARAPRSERSTASPRLSPSLPTAGCWPRASATSCGSGTSPGEGRPASHSRSAAR